ncbi:MAG: alpha/beta fold hydrolase [Terriglobales bacterium]
MRQSCLAFLLLAFFAIPVQGQGSRDVDLTEPDGTKLRATYYAAAKPGPGVLLLHQCNRERKIWHELAGSLSAAGLHVMTLDYRGYGESGGERFEDFQQMQPVVREKWPSDVDAAFTYLTAQPGVDKERIGAGGASCGVNQSIQWARRHSEVASLVLLSGGTTTDGRKFLQHTPVPIFVSASEDDGGVVALMRWLQGFSRNPQNKFVQYKKAGHGTDMFVVEGELPGLIVQWFETTLRTAPAKLEAAASGPRASASEEFWAVVEQPGNGAKAAKAYEEAKKRDPSLFLFPESALNDLGYERLGSGHVKDAIEIFKLNVAEYPGSANVYDSLSDAYLADGQAELARHYAEKALQKLEADKSLGGEFRALLQKSIEQKLQTLAKTGTAIKPQ